jgi:sugar/nucleoside kinase (ribokinase family)
MHVEAIGDSWRPADVPELPHSVRWVHVTPLARSDFPPETLALVARRRRLSFDGQGLVRAPVTGPLQLDGDFDPELLRHVWVLKLSDEEAEVVGDVAALGVREVVVTHGSRGATLYVGGTREEVPARPVDGDPTGSGDMFTTAYVIARNGGFAPLGAARRATAVVASILAGK